MTEIVSSQRRRVFEVTGAPGLELVWSAGSDVGLRRAANEDSVVAVPGVFAVADGLGGHAAGDVASDAAVASLASAASDRESSGSILDPADVGEALVAASARIVRATRGALHGSGTTVAGIAVIEHAGVPALQVFNLGDSRVYAFREQALTQVTVDHSYVQELVDSGQITADEAESHPDGNIITRALGFGEMPEIDRWVVHPAPGTRYLICSDGLTRELTNSTIAVLLGMGATAEETVASLIRAAVGAGGRDNVTVAVVDVVAAPDVPEAGAEPIRVRADPSDAAARP